jgi:hypothetical protein
MTTPTPVTAPLPLFHHVASGLIFYIAAGPCPLVFSIPLADARRHAPVTDRSTIHPFGQSTVVASLADTDVRRELGEAIVLQPGPLGERLAAWASYCDDVADRLNEGDDLRAALDVWVVDDGQDVILEDDLTSAPSAAVAG